jgi:peptidoglycan/LPS O-acetylase OafA/YrhL
LVGLPDWIWTVVYASPFLLTGVLGLIFTYWADKPIGFLRCAAIALVGVLPAAIFSYAIGYDDPFLRLVFIAVIAGIWALTVGPLIVAFSQLVGDDLKQLLVRPDK